VPPVADPQGGHAQAGIELGRVVGVFGVQGWIRLRSHTDPPEQILKYRRWTIAGQEWKVVAGRAQGDTVVAQLEGLADRDAALKLRGGVIEVQRKALPKARSGEHYWTDLLGSEVVNGQGTVLGTLKAVTHNGAQDVMIVQGDVERLIPYVRGPIVTSVAPGRIVVDWQADY